MSLGLQHFVSVHCILEYGGMTLDQLTSWWEKKCWRCVTRLIFSFTNMYNVREVHRLFLDI